MDLKEYAEKELRSSGMFDKDSDYNGMIGDAVMELIQTFSNQGHSGFSADITLKLFEKLARFQPLSPINDNDEEWTEVGDGLYQHNRNSAVFKEGKYSRPYFINAYVQVIPDGSCWSGGLSLKDGRSISRCYIKDFNKMPTIKINVLEREFEREYWETWVEDESQLEELSKYYDFEIRY